MTPRDDLARFLAEFVSELGGAVTLTVHDEGWDLEPVNASASPVTIRGLQPDLGDLSIRFGHLGRVEFWQGEEMEDALERVKLHVRGVAAGGLTETRRGRDDSRWRGSRWTLELPDGEVRRGFVNWFPWSWGAEEHFGPWDQRAGRVPTDEAGEVDGALRSRLDRWFSTVDLDDERIAPTVEEALRQLVRMLDALAPTRVDRDRSAILSHSYGWTPQTIGIYVAHDNDQHDGLLIELADTNAVVKWLGPRARGPSAG